MPFDGGNIAPEILIIDKVIDTLKSPKYWCKRELSHTNKGTFRTTRQYCLMGALNLADHQDVEYPFISTIGTAYKTETSNVIKKMAKVLEETDTDIGTIKSILEIVKFNNCDNTTHKDICELLLETRKAFEFA